MLIKRKQVLAKILMINSLVLWCMACRSDHHMLCYDSGASAVHSVNQSSDDDRETEEDESKR